MSNTFKNGKGYQLSQMQTELLRSANPTIDLFGEVDKDMFFYVRAAIMALRAKGNPEVQVTISSPGGGVDPGLDIYDMLRLYEGKKIATIHDQAASMGALILQACDVRRCALHSHVLIHHISRGNVTLDILRSKKKLEDMQEDMERSQRRLYAILANKTGKTVSQIRSACAKDTYMTSEEALEFGLIDEII